MSERIRVREVLLGQGFHVIDSDANFLLFGTFADSAAAWRQFLDAGVLLRDMGIAGYLRATIGTEPENDAFLAACAAIGAERVLDNGQGDLVTQMAGAPRRARISRTTSESSVLVELDLDGTGVVEVSTGVRFYDHMLTAFGVHGSFDLTVQSTGDVDIDAHHTVEDTAIVLGQAIGQALGDKAGIRRFGDAFIPMDETLAHAAVDVSGRPFSVHTGEPDAVLGFTVGGNYPVVLNRHVFDSLAFHARIALHVRVLYGRDPHHICEAQYKAIARALRAAVEPDPRATGIPSTKGVL